MHMFSTRRILSSRRGRTILLGESYGTRDQELVIISELATIVTFTTVTIKMLLEAVNIILAIVLFMKSIAGSSFIASATKLSNLMPEEHH